MSEHPHYDDHDVVNVETHHEKSDVNVRGLIWFVIIVVVFAAVAHLLIYFVFRGLVIEERHRNRGALSGIKQAPGANVPTNQPLLQPFPREIAKGVMVPPYRSTPVSDLAAMRETEQRTLTTYGWVDQQKGVVRIPIDVAMKLTLQRGLPLQAQLPPPAATATTTAAGGMVPPAAPTQATTTPPAQRGAQQ